MIDAMTTNRDRPILLLDVDGVLNIMPGVTKARTSPPEGFRDAWVPLNDHRRAVLVNPEIGSRLVPLTEEVDVVWFTSWAGNANTAIAPLFGLPTTLNWWPARETEHKEVSLIRFLRNYAMNHYRMGSGPTRILAVDDVLGESSTVAAAAWEPMVEYSTIQTDPAVGLRHADVDAIIDWARA